MEKRNLIQSPLFHFLGLLFFLLLLSVTVVAHADTVITKDGAHLQGVVKRTAHGWTVTSADGKTTELTAENVVSIEVNRSNGDEASASVDRLASLRRVADKMDDPQQVIDRYEKFIAQPDNSSAKAEASKDLTVWHDRLDQGLVRIGAKWVTSAERDAIRKSAQEHALAARDLIVQNRFKEADPLLTQALAEDPQSATALYLRGIMQYQQDQWVASRKTFEAVNTLIPNYAPVLNDLAVLAWRQKSYIGAMSLYDQAMQAAPQSQAVLDNVAEALHSLPDGNSQSPLVKRAAARFTQQDTTLQQTLAAHDLYRWGATWVNAKQLDILKAAEAKIQAQLDQITQQGEQIKKQMAEIDSNIDANNRQLRRLEANSIGYDQNGNPIQLPLPAVYYDIQRDNQKQAADKRDAQSQFDQLGAQYKQVQNSGPTPKFVGEQKMIGVEATPLRNFGNLPGTGGGADPIVPPGGGNNPGNGGATSRASSPSTSTRP